MTKILLYLIVMGTSGVSLIHPWVGVVAYYLNAVLFPQSIWPWIFRDLRVSLVVAAATCVGFLFSMVTGRVNFHVLATKQNLYLAMLWICVLISYYFSPYGFNVSETSAVNSSALMTHLNKVFLFYFIAVLFIDTEKKLYFLCLVLLVTVISFTVWANIQYLSGAMTGYRLAGPDGGVGDSIYTDENCFAMVLVVGTAFLYNFVTFYKNKGLRWLLIGIIPFAWHAIFLTGSRGGLVGIAAVSLIAGLQARSRKILAMLVLTLSIAFLWQAGPYLLGRADTIKNYEGDGSAMGRIHAWQAGFRMIADHPFTGVGPGNFMVAFPDYSGERVRVSHNTVMQFGSESGVLAALLYMGFFYNAFRQGRSERALCNSPGFNPRLKSMHQAAEGGLFGFFVCSLFLNLATFEVFYYLLILRESWRRVVFSEPPSGAGNESQPLINKRHAGSAIP